MAIKNHNKKSDPPALELKATPQVKKVRRAPEKFSRITPDAVGTGVKRDRETPEKKEQSQETVSLDAPVEWVDAPQLEDQILKEGMWKHDRVEIKILDLSNDEDVKVYNELATFSGSRSSNVFITSEEQKFCEKTGSWKMLLKLQYVKFKKIIKKKSNE